MLTLLGVMLPLLAWLALVQVGFDEAVAARFEADSIRGRGTGQVDLVIAGLKLFSHNPIFGVGEGAYRIQALPFLPPSWRGHSVHNSYVDILSESGLVGFVPYATLLWFAFRQLLRKHGHAAPGVEHWRPFFLAGFVAILLTDILGDNNWERPLWFVIAFAGALERYEATWAHKRRAQLTVSTESDLDSRAPPEPQSSPSGFH